MTAFDFPTGLFFSSTVSSLSQQSGFSKSCRSIAFFLKSPQPCSHKAGVYPLHLLSHRHTGVHALKYTKANTHRDTVARACVHMCSFVEACTSFFNAQVTSYPRRLCTFIRATSSVICRTMQTNKNTRKKNIYIYLYLYKSSVVDCKSVQKMQKELSTMKNTVLCFQERSGWSVPFLCIKYDTRAKEDHSNLTFRLKMEISLDPAIWKTHLLATFEASSVSPGKTRWKGLFLNSGLLPPMRVLFLGQALAHVSENLLQLCFSGLACSGWRWSRKKQKHPSRTSTPRM